MKIGDEVYVRILSMQGHNDLHGEINGINGETVNVKFFNGIILANGQEHVSPMNRYGFFMPGEQEVSRKSR